MWVLLSADFETRSALALLQELQLEAEALTNEQLKTAFKVLQGIRGKFKLLILAKGARRLLSQLLAPRVADLDITPLQLREAGFDLECLGQAGCTA
eukprot:5769039-Pleurochrysis_carterae.AAC.1